MYQGKNIAVVVPAYNEEQLIGRVLETMPAIVDKVIVIDDTSSDKTSEKALSYMPAFQDRLIVIRHEKNLGVGGAIVTGHKKALELGMDVVAIMAGDAQMDPSELEKILTPVVEGKCDYAKGNRFFNGEAWQHMPKVRFMANAGLSMLNKIASGFWNVADPQCGYTAISSTALKGLPLDSISKGYHFENSMLVNLNVQNMSVLDVPIKAIYGIGEKSGINEVWALFSFSQYLWKTFLWRLKEKYVIRDFHPLVLFYFFGLITFIFGLIMGGYLTIYRLFVGLVQSTSALFATFLFISGLQLILFAMWFDKDYSNK